MLRKILYFPSQKYIFAQEKKFVKEKKKVLMPSTNNKKMDPRTDEEMRSKRIREKCW